MWTSFRLLSSIIPRNSGFLTSGARAFSLRRGYITGMIVRNRPPQIDAQRLDVVQRVRPRPDGAAIRSAELGGGP